jgi:predicted amidohydrolase YtcJ
MPLDMLVSGGRIATFAGESGFGWVEAIGIRDGKVAFAGSAIDLETRADPHTRRIELEPGEIAMPGIIDAHIHLVDTALAVDHVDLSIAPTLEAAMAIVRAATARIAAPGWLVGFGWDQRRWGVFPSADDLERVAPGRMVSLWSFDHHSLVASHAALAAASIDAATPDPAGGVIRRGPHGSPDGVLLENAAGLVVDQVPKPEAEDVRRALIVLGRRLLEVGVVGAHEPGSLAADPSNRILDLYADMAGAGELAFRIRAGVQDDGLDNAIERGLRSGAAIGGSDPAWLAMGWLKLFADGTLGSRTAALLEPLEGGGGTGIFTTPPEALASLAARAANAGITTQIHAIGDAAVRAALDALAPTAGSATYMPRLEHIQLCHPDDRRRFGALGVAASVQPVHLREDAATARRDWGDRAESGGYAWKSLLDAGAVVAFGTDAPVVPIDPWPGIALAVLRRDPTWGTDIAPYGPHEAVTLEESLRAATVGVATAARDKLGGRLIPGSPADLIVLPAAPRESEEGSERAASWAEVRPRITMVAGEVGFER